MLVGLVSTAVYIFLYLGWFFIPGTNMLPNTPDAHWLGISPAAFGPVGALLNFVVAYVISSMTKAPPQDVQDLIQSIRVPKGAGAAQAH
jgi:cation/acetate symporter